MKYAFLFLLLSGCASASYNGLSYFSFAKDISAEGELYKPDGTMIKLKITSSVNNEAIKAAAEGAANGVTKGLKP